MWFNFSQKNMHISIHFLQVLFMLSTIVLVTDCCSSKVISLKEQTLKIVQQQKQFQQQRQQQQQQQRQRQHHLQNPLQSTHKIPQHVELATETNFGKIANSESVIDGDNDSNNYNNSMIVAIDTYMMFGGGGVNGVTTPSSQQKNQTQNDTKIQLNETAAVPNFEIVNVDVDVYYTIMRDVLSFECSGQYLTDFCLNRGRCFRYPVGNHSFFSCECADGYIGERCESKSFNDYTVPHRARAKRSTKIFTARHFFTFPTLIVLSMVQVLLALLVVLGNSKQTHPRDSDVVTVTAVIV